MPRAESVLNAYTALTVDGALPNDGVPISVISMPGDIGVVRKPEPARPRWSG